MVDSHPRTQERRYAELSIHREQGLFSAMIFQVWLETVSDRVVKKCWDQLLTKRSPSSGVLLQRLSFEAGLMALFQGFQGLLLESKQTFTFFILVWPIALYIVPASPGQQFVAICIGSPNYSINDSANIVWYRKRRCHVVKELFMYSRPLPQSILRCVNLFLPWCL